jgi:microcystin-dependent protein
MAEPFLSEIRIMSFNFAPKGWAMCNGQLMPINQNQALFSLLGTTYGGDGRINFALPNLQGSVPIHTGNGFTLGEKGGEQSHTLSTSEIPNHIHTANASSAQGNAAVPTNALLASPLNLSYSPQAGGTTTLIPATVANAGGSQPHQNMQPFLTLTFCIALQGIFPSPN